jgi:rSAM/selenodomain-associated transferase 1
VVVVFAKAPRAGAVKTRMSPPLSAEEAAELYARLLADVLEATGRFAPRLGLAPLVAVHPAEACREIARSAPTPFRVIAQRGATLAERMAWAVREAAAGGAARILLRGSDSPLLDAGCLAATLRALDAADLSLCPDRDGGYSLVGLRRPAPGLFEQRMSTPSVLADTLAKAERLGLRVALQPPSFDLDRVQDLGRLALQRAAGEALCPRTLEFLDARDLWRLANSD